MSSGGRPTGGAAPAPRLVARAPGKANLGLFVGAPRADGLHPLASLVVPLSLADELVLSSSATGGDEVACPGVAGPNLVEAAVAAFRAATGWDGPPVRVDVVKRIPVAAGMGGGSADAAAALRLLARRAGPPHDAPAALERIAAELGSDVPALLPGGPCLMEGAGERVTSAGGRALRGLGVVVLPSPEALRTPEVYAAFDARGAGRGGGELAELGRRLAAVLARGEVPAGDLLRNDLAASARALAPSIDGALAALRAAGADRVLVSGSGPTALGLCLGGAGPERARGVASRLDGAVASVPVGADVAAVRVAAPSGAVA